MDLFSDDARRDPFALHDQLRARGALHLPGPDLWFVFGYQAVKRVLTDHETFSADVGPTRGAAFQWLLFMDPPRHTRMRAIIAKAFTARSIAALEPRIRALSRLLLERLPARGEVDLVAAYGARLPMMVIAQLMGLPVDDEPRLTGWSEAIVNLGATIAGADGARATAEFFRADGEMAAYFGATIDERQRRPADDLLGRLVAAEVDGERLTSLEILRFCQLLLAAGSETTTNLIDNAIIELCAHPEAMAAVRADPARIPATLEETLRHRTPLQAMFRTTRGEVELDGARIPGGKLIVAAIGAANRDPRQFAEPHRFDPAREPNHHLAFGHGIHACLGAPLARLEGRIALGDLLARWRRIELVNEAWPPRASFHVHGPRALAIVVEE
jgi:cytochrome P450